MATTSARALRTLSILSTGVLVTAEELADRLGVGVRTVRRDIATLRDLGYEIEPVTGLGGGYRLGGGSRLPPMVFDEDQVVAIAVALQTAPSVLTGIDDSRARALRTVRQVMPERLRLESDAFTVTLVPNYWEFPAAPIDAGVVRDVGAAVRRRHVLRAEYAGAADEPERLRVEPYRVIVWAARWYLLAFDLEREAWRVLRLDRLTAKPPTYVPFAERPLPGASAEDVVKRTVDRGDSLAGWPCRGSAVLAVPPGVAAEFAPGGAVVETVDDERCRLRMGAWSWVGLAGLYITFGSPLSEVEPVELREAFARVRALTEEVAGAP
ncbi:WYL domain-containing protein [Microcella daejeonensis]|uniref:helix-turn-helix transcriptional regulator n=1 Tax=Microcella daejeonensis TaxID=2994971 RepID=UPI0022706E30|nr:WYL domain-containing protein [Microcella daejeonensis]WAB84476.1 WYL domain-containing protein [Microcella daejeonensis]